ncbi:MAG: hypothetical protein LBD53_10595 [Tannerella sp.]|nr:hypothetical protein [Tannerella sp.]
MGRHLIAPSVSCSTETACRVKNRCKGFGQNRGALSYDNAPSKKNYDM